MSKRASTSRVFGSNTRACGAEIVDGQTDTIWPLFANASDPQIDGLSPLEVDSGLRPSGPEMSYASVIHVSLWMFENGLRPMCGFCGATVGRTRSGVAGAPWYGASDVGGAEGIGAAEAAGAATSSAPTARVAARGVMQTTLSRLFTICQVDEK